MEGGTDTAENFPPYRDNAYKDEDNSVTSDPTLSTEVGIQNLRGNISREDHKEGEEIGIFQVCEILFASLCFKLQSAKPKGTKNPPEENPHEEKSQCDRLRERRE